MKKFILASVSALALLSAAACSDSTDNTTTQSVPQTEDQVTPVPVEPANPDAATPPATDNTTTQGITPAPETGTGGDMQTDEPVKPVEPAPAQ